MTNQFFTNAQTVTEVKKQYKELVWIHHPDMGGDTATMQDLNNQYQAALARCDGQVNLGTDGKDHTYKYDQEIEQAIIDKISELISLKLEGIEVWLIGTWVWVGGETYPHRTALKEAGLQFNGKRKMWQFHTGPKYRRYNKNANFADLAATYGATRFQNSKTEEKALV